MLLCVCVWIEAGVNLIQKSKKKKFAKNFHAQEFKT